MARKKLMLRLVGIFCAVGMKEERGWATSLPGWPACPSLSCCAQNPSGLLSGDFIHLQTVSMVLKKIMCKPSVS